MCGLPQHPSPPFPPPLGLPSSFSLCCRMHRPAWLLVLAYSPTLLFSPHLRSLSRSLYLPFFLNLRSYLCLFFLLLSFFVFLISLSLPHFDSYYFSISLFFIISSCVSSSLYSPIRFFFMPLISPLSFRPSRISGNFLGAAMTGPAYDGQGKLPWKVGNYDPPHTIGRGENGEKMWHVIRCCGCGFLSGIL